MSIIYLEKISKIYGKKTSTTLALDNINLSIDKSEFIAIMGPSGSGKSTLLNIIGCIDKMSDGSYLLGERHISQINNKEICLIRNKTFGFVFQNFALFSEYSAIENIEMPLFYRNTLVNRKERINNKIIREKANEFLAKVGMEKHKNKRPSELSGGQQQRVAIARALITNPDIIIADEPTGALDQKNGEEIMKLLKESNKEGKTVIIVTHDDKIASYCKRKIKLIDGVIKDDVFQ